MAEALVSQYERGEFDRRAFFNAHFGPAVQSLAAEIMTLQDEPSANWQRKKQISVPRLDENATEAATSAMVYLKLARIDEQVRFLLEQMKRRESTGENVDDLRQRHKQLMQIRQAVKERKFIVDVE